MYKFRKVAYTLLFTACFFSVAYGQEDLLSEIDNERDTAYIGSAFKGTRLVNGHTVELRGAGTLEFIFSHRFGRINGGLYEMFGLDEAFVRIGLDYSLTDRIGLGFGRNSVDKTVDLYAKYAALKQSETMPVSLTLYGNGAYKTSPKKEDVPAGFKDTDRLSYTGQILIARKLSQALSLQLMPTVVHKNYINPLVEEGDQYALGAGGKLSITRSVSLNIEYYHHLNPVNQSPYQNALGLGVDIETGGHVFQLMLTNSRGMIERTFITETDGNFFDGDIHFGFNVTRSFQLGKR